MLSVEEANRLVAENIGLAGTSVRLARCPTRLIEYEDQIQIALLGIVRGARNFDSSRASFSTFAVSCGVRQLLTERGRMLNARRVKPAGQCGSDTFAFESVPDPHRKSNLDLMAAQEVWQTAVLKLGSAEKEVIVGRFVTGKKLREIGRILGVGAARVQQIEVEAVAKVARAYIT